MVYARLSIITCDKCGQLMEKGQKIIIVTEGKIARSDDELDFLGSCVRYACHLDCWDGIEENFRGNTSKISYEAKNNLRGSA